MPPLHKAMPRTVPDPVAEIPRPSPARVEVIVPNFKRRLSGVTATIVRLVPVQARQVPLATLGPGLPEGFPGLSVADFVLMPRTGPGGRPRVWHARRNTEMIGGLATKYLLGKRLKLVFTSASQREQTWLTRWLIRRMDAVIATSGRTAAFLQRPATVILHGIDAETFTPLSGPARTDLRRRLGLPDQGRIVACYGRIRAQKGTDVFVDAMLNLLPGRPDLTALVMGRATERHRAFERDLRARVEAAGLSDRLLFLPEVTVDRMADWYQVLDLFVAPQRWEGFGLTPLEAMACGVPVVATTVGAFPELVVDGTTGRLVPPGDAEAMAVAAAELLDDPARLSAAATAARDHVLAGFRIEAEAQAITDLYRALLDGTYTEPRPQSS
jgi:mannosyltransferase